MHNSECRLAGAPLKASWVFVLRSMAGLCDNSPDRGRFTREV
jgi:hypothetical protein